MIIDDIKSNSEIETCVRMYLALNDETFIKSSFDCSFENIKQIVRRKRFIRVIRENSEIIAWIYAELSKPIHMKQTMLQQMYYCSNQKGFKSVRCIKMLHDSMEEFAIEHNIAIVYSAGSPYDSENVFARVLEKHGWERRGYACIKKLRGYYEDCI